MWFNLNWAVCSSIGRGRCKDEILPTDTYNIQTHAHNGQTTLYITKHRAHMQATCKMSYVRDHLLQIARALARVAPGNGRIAGDIYYPMPPDHKHIFTEPLKTLPHSAQLNTRGTCMRKRTRSR